MTKGIWFFVAIIATFALTAGFALAATPSGANITENITTTAPADAPEYHEAYAGNVTYLTINGFSTTQSWQGYYGNVSGTIQLANSDDAVLYNWSVASPQGEVYATENGTGQVAWGSIACFNFTGNFTDGGPRLNKTEYRFNISSADTDGLNETFSDGNTHSGFYTAGTEFVAGACPSAYMYDNGGYGESGTFEEVLLTDATSDVQLVFASLLEQDLVGFDGSEYDFEMLVLEDGLNTNPTTYYFYVELE